MNPYSNTGYPINTPVRPIQTPQNSYMNISPQMQYQQPLPQPVQSLLLSMQKEKQLVL